MKAFPVGYRHRVVAPTAEGFTSGEIAEVLGASSAWVRSIKALHASGRPLDPQSCADTRRSLAAREGERIRARVRAKPGTTLEDPKRDPALDVSVSDLWYALRDLKVAPEKKRSARPNRIAPTSPPPARVWWRIAPAGLDPRRLDFLDETSGTAAMTRRCCWGPSHGRVDYAAPSGHRETTAFVAAFRLGGLFAPMVVDGALSGAPFPNPYFPDELWFSACQLRRNLGIPSVSDHSLPT